MAYTSVVAEHANEFIRNLHRLHTTQMGMEHIRQNLHLDTDDVVQWCRAKISQRDALIEKAGKNWYVTVENYIVTINAHSYTIITAHILEKT